MKGGTNICVSHDDFVDLGAIYSQSDPAATAPAQAQQPQADDAEWDDGSAEVQESMRATTGRLTVGAGGENRDALDGSYTQKLPKAVQRRMNVVTILIIPLMVLFGSDATFSFIEDDDEWGEIVRYTGTVLWVILMVALFAVGGHKNIDWRVARSIRRTWNVYIILGAGLLNLIVDIVEPYSKASMFDSIVYFTGVIAFIVQDATLNLSAIVRNFAAVLLVFGEVFELALYATMSQDTRLWGTSKNALKVAIYSQMLICSMKGVKRALCDPSRRFLIMPTGHWRRRGEQKAMTDATRRLEYSALATISVNTFVYLLTTIWFENSLACQVIIIFLYILNTGVFIAIFWNNVNAKVLKGLLTSYEVVVINAFSILITCIQTYADSYSDVGHTTVLNVANRTAFVVLSFLFTATDALQKRSLWFRRFNLIWFIFVVLVNLLDSQSISAEFRFNLNGTLVTKSVRSALTTCYLQLITISVPAINCVMTDKVQAKLALVRKKKLRPVPIPDSYFEGWWRPSL